MSKKKQTQKITTANECKYFNTCFDKDCCTNNYKKCGTYELFKEQEGEKNGRKNF